jgi:hypothetical protein
VDQARAARGEHGGEQPGVPSDDGRPGQLPAAGFLLGPGVPDDGEQRDQPDDDRDEAALPGQQLPEVRAVQRAVADHERRAGHVDVVEVLPRRGVRVGGLDRRQVTQRRERQDDDPQWHEEPVAAQHQPQQ